mmetsp:Transcript_5113/g.7878  ORF Transcript_5113/g.7878 Transcript_5113/m.7878 type:complete len:540 (-) Transcript_5113:1384-3003(-)
MLAQISLLSTILIGISFTAVDGHGLLTVPASKNGGTVSIPLESTSKHYTLASYGIIDKAFFDQDHSKTPWTRPGDFDHILANDLLAGHPETLHPCGCNAGDVSNCAGVIHASGFGETTLGNMITPPTWRRGSTQETAWNAWVNHAGGHIYMLCKKTQFDSCRDTMLPPNPLDATKEQEADYLQCVWDCFESNTLEWGDAGEGTDAWSQKLQYQDDHCTYVTMDPTTKVGKNGSLWRFTPIPDSLQVSNGGEGKCTWDSVASFSNSKALDHFVESFGNEAVCDWGLDSHAPSDWHLFDKVEIPMDIEEGEYLLSWRWDAYTADQMWTNCADITIAPPLEGDETQGSSNFDDECPPNSNPTPVPAPPISTSPISSTEEPTPLPTPAPIPSPVSSPPSPMPNIVNPPTTPSLSCPSGYTGIRPHDHCTKYYHCVGGNLAGEVLGCPAGTLFDVNYQYCNWSNLVTCETPVTGCYSNNFKDCNHPDYQFDNASCDTIWLPNGSRNSCIALWGSCTNDEDNCCEPAVCYKGNEESVAQCIVLSA